MGEEVKFDSREDRIAKWEAGLPAANDLTPLSQLLIPRDLAAAFKISPEPYSTLLDVNRASQDTLSSLRGSTANGCFNFKPFIDDNRIRNRQGNSPAVWDQEMVDLEPDEPDCEETDPKKTRRMEPEGGDSDTFGTAITNCTDDQSADAKALKRARLVWTPQLHKRFVDVVDHLGLKNAVPKSIMQLMNVEGLTRENVASHLQKYRLFVKRRGLPNDGTLASDNTLASMSVQSHSFNESSNGVGDFGHGNGNANEVNNGGGGGADNGNHVGVPIPMPYPSLQIMHMPIMGMGLAAHGHGHGQMRMPVGSLNLQSGFGHDSHAHHHYQQQYNTMVQQQRDWSGNKYNGLQHLVTPNDK